MNADESDGLPPIVDAVDFVNYPKEITEQEWIDTEENYRRGFSHGLACAVETIRSLKKLGYVRPNEISNIIEHFLLETIYPWRYRADTDVKSAKGELTELLCGHPQLNHESWPSIRLRILARDGRRCQWCGSTKHLQVDHVHSVDAGGLPVDSNLQVLCKACNIKKMCS